MLPNTTKQLIVFDGHKLDQERVRLRLTKVALAQRAGVSYRSGWRVLASMAVGREIGERVVAVLGFSVDHK